MSLRERIVSVQGRHSILLEEGETWAQWERTIGGVDYVFSREETDRHVYYCTSRADNADTWDHEITLTKDDTEWHD